MSIFRLSPMVLFKYTLSGLKAAIPSKADLGYQSTVASHICPLLYA